MFGRYYVKWGMIMNSKNTPFNFSFSNNNCFTEEIIHLFLIRKDCKQFMIKWTVLNFLYMLQKREKECNMLTYFCFFRSVNKFNYDTDLQFLSK